MTIRIAVSPHGRLLCEQLAENGESSLKPADLQTISESFEESSAAGLVTLVRSASAGSLAPDLLFWTQWTRGFFDAVAGLDEQQWRAMGTKATARMAVPAWPDDALLQGLVDQAPPMRGLEYLTPAVLKQLWTDLIGEVSRQAAKLAEGIPELLHVVNPQRHLLGRVTFHLAENKRDEDRPFAFLATYTHAMSASATVQHLPLAKALEQYAGERNQAKLAELLAPVRTAAEKSPLIKELLQSRRLFQPQAWTISQAYKFLRDVSLMEQSGLVVRVPNWWSARKPPRPSVQVRIGEQKASSIGLSGLLDFSVDVALDGAVLTDEERKQMLNATEGLILLRGKWVEVNSDQLNQALSHWKQLQNAHADGINFLQGMRLLAGTPLDSKEEILNETANWVGVTAGDWLKSTLAQLRNPHGVSGCSPGLDLKATLRPYQADGVRWMWFMTRLGLGACLADDMGLGKTIQVIDLLLRLRVGNPSRSAVSVPSLLIVPASLVGNWKQELAKFAPQIRVFFAHRSETDAESLEAVDRNPKHVLETFELVVTTYTLARKAKWPNQVTWNLVILDEAQAIKNAASAQTKAIKNIESLCRIVLTGTPVENHLGDLWSLFDFCCPGLLGSASQFKNFVKRLEKKQDANGYGALRRLVQPYILRRMKTDPNIVPDLPDKTEMRVDCGLSKKQAALYERLVGELAEQLQSAKEGIQRRGLVLAMLMKLKQVCNHPSQFLDQREFEAADSGKFLQLAQICEPILQRQEKVLIFTQFQSLCDPLSDYCCSLFGHRGPVLHGGVPVARRKDLVKQFQEDETISYFVISVKAGGTGLNLTAASHVVHFDRWWNPAVENQATDRAFRIGQKKNVLVHKFVCRGTLEERIDAMIRDKQDVADQILGRTAEGETLLTEMSDRELLNFVALDITRAAEDVGDGK